ncbi:MAG: hypothetical protein KC418_22220 [Anaerolineales bacterium]|nr:hypothetical protein [Anaerolineales bacterium]
MVPSPSKQIQRTIVVVGPGLADAIGQALCQRWHSPLMPQPALAVVFAATAEFPTTFIAALRRISPLNLSQTLAARGWTLLRHEQIVAYLLIDTTTTDPASVNEWLRQIKTSVESVFGDDSHVALLALYPWENAAASPTPSSGWLSSLRDFPPDVWLLSLINEARFCLSGAAEFAAVVTDIIDTLITSPLQTVPQRMTTITSRPSASFFVGSIGLASWTWDTLAEQEYLAIRWVEDVLQRWRRALTADEIAETTISGQNWWVEKGLSLAQLSANFESSPASPVPLWHYPQPWHIHNRLAALEAASKSALAPSTSPQTQVPLSTRLTNLMAGLMPALFHQLALILDEQPIAGVNRALSFLDFLQMQSQEARSWLDERQQIQHQRIETVQIQAATLRQRLTDCVARWPSPHWRAWVKTMLSPWRWPRMSWRYWQMQKTAAAWRLLIQEQRQWHQQTIMNQLLVAFYEEVTSLICHLRQNVDEIDDMLAFLSGQAVAPDAENASLLQTLRPFADYLLHRYDTLFTDLDQEANLAGRGVGGLGQHVAQLDDATLWPDLRATAQKRLQAIAHSTAVETILRLYHTPEMLSTWWQQQWETSAPLWPVDETTINDAERVGMKTMTYICGNDVFRLADALGLTTDPAYCWLEMDAPDLLLVSRWRAGIPLAATNPDKP